MPPRYVILAIIAFWLATTAWLIYREVLPTLESGDPPPYSIDLADEVSAATISWLVWDKGEKIGTVHTMVRRQSDRTFALEGDFRATNLRLAGMNVRQRSRYIVTRNGDLRALSTQVKVTLGGHAIELNVDGNVEKGWFTPHVRVSGVDTKLLPIPKMEPVSVAGHGSVLNPLHPLNRLRGLRGGQHWVQPLFDPLAVAVNSLAPQPPQHLHAEVLPGALSWNGAEFPCWKIEYRERNKVVARTWVRQEDALVLQQEASHAVADLILQRIPIN